MKKIDMTNVQTAGEFNKLPAGAYICKIVDVKDVPEKEYLKVTYDISEGEYANHFSAIRKEHPDWEWTGAYVKSYKTAALPMFKRFCSVISKSNGNYIFDGGAINSDESTLKGKQLGLILREEEYYSNSGDIRTRLIVHTEFAVDSFSSQKVPDVKRVKREDAPAHITTEFMTVPEVDTDEVPF